MCREGYVTALTSRGADGADLLATKPDCSSTIAIQVKTNGRNANFWLLGASKSKREFSSNFYFVFVNIIERKQLNEKCQQPELEYYIVPSKFISDNYACDGPGRPDYIMRDIIEKYKNKWKFR
jgi:hypothetical protein